MHKRPTTAAPRVSVVMPVYNAESYLDQAIESVLGQTLEQLELVVVDDGSRDGSRSILERFARADGRIAIVANQRNQGISTARNRGWSAARAPYVAVLDADDVALPHRLSLQADFLDAHPTVAAVGGAAITIDTSGRRISTRRYPTSSRVIRSTLLRHNCLAHSAVMMRRTALEEVGGYRFSNEAEDYDLWLRLSSRHDLANVSEPLVLHRLHLQQQSLRILEQTRASWAVLAAAHARRGSGIDPLAGVADLTPEVIDGLGLNEGKVRAAVERECVARAAILAELDHHDEARRLISETARHDGGRATRAFAATTELKRAEATARAGRPLSATEHVLRAFREDPRQAATLIMQWLGPRVPGGGLLRWT